LEDGLKILRQVAAGLDHLHAKGLVHQDVKPQNLFVTQTGEVRVLDYGIAKVVRAYGAPGAQASGGTLAYMAPEQLRGEAVDRRADVYAFGLVCVEVLTGKLPFDVRDAKAVTAWHLDSGHAMPSLPAGSPAKSMTACLAVDSSARPLSAGVALVELVQDEERRAEVSQGIAREHAASGQAVPSRTAKGVIHYAGQSALFDITLSVSLDGRVMGNGSFKRGFQFPFEVGEGAHLLSVRAYKFLTMTFPLDFEAGGEYVITLSDLNVGQEKCDVRRAK
jgi:serine/threonine protein kinase